MIAVLVLLVWLASVLCVTAHAYKAKGARSAVGWGFAIVVWLMIGTVFLALVASPSGQGACEGFRVPHALVLLAIGAIGLLPSVAYVLRSR